MKPAWNTRASDLGVIKEGQYYKFEFDAERATTYKVVTGKLPKGIELNETTGVLSGTPNSNNNESDTLYRFTIRARNNDGLKDKSFTLTIAKHDKPEWNSPTTLDPIDDLQYVNIKINVVDDNNDNIIYDLTSGTLPDGTELTSTGYINGFVEPVSSPTTLTFTIRASDGQTSIIRTFMLTVNQSSNTRPIFKHTESNIGTFTHDNRFSFKVTAIDYNRSNSTYYDLVYTMSGSHPNGLTIDPRTGWIHGVLPFISKDREEFTFTVTATSTRTATYTFKMALLFSPDSEIKWKTDENLGTIVAGTISTLNVEAETHPDTPLIYELDENNNTLPAGMRLNSSGELTGRPSFQTFQLDAGTTTFDGITIDKNFSFTVTVRNIARTLSNERTFNLIVEPVENNKPKEDWYIDLFPNDAERRIWEDIVYNRQDIPDQYLYRSSDIYFGRQGRARVLFVPGLPAETIDDYFKYVFKNHYTINIRFGDFKYAKATNNNGDYIYDVVYVDVIDKFDPPKGKNINLEIEYEQNEFSNIPTIDESGTIDNSNLYSGTTSVNKLFPASLKRMKARLEQILGSTIDISTLPDWMSTVQDDGSVIGYIPVCPIAYVKPGLGKKVLHYLNTNDNIRLHEVDFTVDRYVIDQYFTKNYNTETNVWDGTEDVEHRTNILDGNRYLKFPREDITDLP